jgi:hypothetical protein
VYTNWLSGSQWKSFKSLRNSHQKKNTHLLTKFDELREAWPPTLERDIEENSIQRCSSVRCQTLMVKERKLKFGAQACGYISEQKQKEWLEEYEEVGRMLGGMIAHPERFCH